MKHKEDQPRLTRHGLDIESTPSSYRSGESEGHEERVAAWQAKVTAELERREPGHAAKPMPERI